MLVFYFVLYIMHDIEEMRHTCVTVDPQRRTFRTSVRPVAIETVTVQHLFDVVSCAYIVFARYFLVSVACFELLAVV